MTGVELSVEPARSRVDSPIRVTARGLIPGERVSLRTMVADGALRPWESMVQVDVDSAGTVDLSRDAAVAGSSYEGIDIDAAGFLWSMTAPDRTQFFVRTLPLDLKYRVELLRAENVVALAEFRRHFGDDVTCEDVQQAPVVGTIARPRDDHPRPGVLMLHGSDSSRLDHAASLLASEGYVVLALRWFGAEDRPAHLVDIELNDIDAAINYLLASEWVIGHQVAVIGLSRGAELALEVAANNSRVGPVIALSQSSVRQAGIGQNYSFTKPAWLRDGEALDWVRGSGGGFAAMVAWLTSAALRRPMRQKRSFLKALKDTAQVELASIAVEDCCGPLTLIYGDDDGLWPSGEYTNRIRDRLIRHGWSGSLRVERMPGAGHFVGFPYALPTMPSMCSLEPSAGFAIDFGGTPLANARAAHDSWEVVRDELSFWGRTLRNDVGRSEEL